MKYVVNMSLHVEVCDYHRCVIHLLRLRLAQVFDLLRHKLAARPRLLHSVLADDLTNVLWLQVIPHSVRSNREEPVALLQLVANKLGLASHTDLMCNQITQ